VGKLKKKSLKNKKNTLKFDFYQNNKTACLRLCIYVNLNMYISIHMYKCICVYLIQYYKLIEIKLKKQIIKWKLIVVRIVVFYSKIALNGIHTIFKLILDIVVKNMKL